MRAFGQFQVLRFVPMLANFTFELNQNTKICDRDRIRTCDRLLRRQMLYPTELRDLIIWVGKSSKANLIGSQLKMGYYVREYIALLRFF